MEALTEKSIIKLEDIKKEYTIKKHIITGKATKKVQAVKNMSFILEEGKTLGIVGESGSGKSTAGEIAGGLLRPTMGKVYYLDKSVEEMTKKDYWDYRRNVQFVFQDPKGSMDPNYTIGKIISEPLYTLRVTEDNDEANRIVDKMLERVGLDLCIKNKYPSEISGGQCQRAAIARALVVNPKVIICDEPVSALDVSIQAQILNLLKELQREYKISYIFISHDIGVVNFMSDKILVMNKGSVVEMGDAEEILSQPKEKYTKKLIASAFIC